MSHYHFVTVSLPEVDFLLPKDLQEIKDIVKSEVRYCKHVQVNNNIDRDMYVYIFCDGDTIDFDRLEERLKKFYFDLKKKEVDVIVGARF